MTPMRWPASKSWSCGLKVTVAWIGWFGGIGLAAASPFAVLAG